MSPIAILHQLRFKLRRSIFDLYRLDTLIDSVAAYP